MIFITNNNTTEVLEPGKQPLHLPSLLIPSQRSTVLRNRLFPVIFMRGDHFNSAFLGQAIIQLVAVIRSVANYFSRYMLKKTRIQCIIDQRYFMRLSTGCVNGERNTKSVCEAHDFGAFALFGFAHTSAPFFAGAKVPSINPSLRSIPPRSCKSLANAVRIFSKTPDSIHSWNRRWQVLRGGYRSGRSIQGAPVRKIHRIPLRMFRGSCGGRPDWPGRALGLGIKSLIRFHCSFVRSIDLKSVHIITYH